jgi:cysteine protease ATG4
MGVSEGKAIGEWFGPNTTAQVLKKLVVYDDRSKLTIHVAMDNLIIEQDVKLAARTPILRQRNTDIETGSNGII